MAANNTLAFQVPREEESVSYMLHMYADVVFGPIYGSVFGLEVDLARTWTAVLHPRPGCERSRVWLSGCPRCMVPEEVLLLWKEHSISFATVMCTVLFHLRPTATFFGV